MATQCIYTIMNKIYRLVVFCLFFLNLSYAMDDYSACVRSCTDLNNPQALYISCRKYQTDYNSTICKLRNASEMVVAGRIKSITDLHEYANPNEALLEYVPYNLDEGCDIDDGNVDDWTHLSKSKNSLFKLEIIVSRMYDEQRSIWRKKDSSLTIFANVQEGWIWNGDPTVLHHVDQVHWDDSLRLFFVKKTDSRPTLVGYSKPIKSDKVDEKWMCGDASDISGVFKETHYCSSFDPYVYSESILYEGNPTVDVVMAKKEGKPNYIIYGNVKSVTATSLELTEDDERRFRNSMDIQRINNKLKEAFIKRLKELKKFRVTYVISKKASFDTISKKWNPANGLENVSTVQYEGWSIDEHSAFLIHNTIDSLKKGNYIFSGYRKKGANAQINYVSRPMNGVPSGTGFRQLWTKKINSGCYVRPSELRE